MNDERHHLYWSPFYEEQRPAVPLWKLGEYTIVRCADSRLVCLGNPLDEEQLAEFYSLQYFEGDSRRKGYTSYAADEAVIRSNFRRHARAIAHELGQEGRDTAQLTLLDYGCAYGYFLDEARGFFGEVRGIEINDEVARVGRGRFGLRVDSHQNALADIGAESVDVVTMWDVIEHLRAPRSALTASARALKRGGSIYLSTGDIGSPLARLMGRRWRLINPPQHISYFSVQTLTQLLQECGFEVVRVRHHGKRVSLGFIWFIMCYLLGLGDARPPKCLDWLMRRNLPVNLFDVMYVSARKR